MKGIVFNLLEEVVRHHYGDDTWDDLLDTAGVHGAYTSLGSYADEEVFKLVMAAASALKQPPEAILRWFGRQAMPRLAERYPMFFSGHGDSRSFLLTLNHIIHPEVRKLYPGATTPVFDFDTSDDRILRIGYRSERRLCALAEGFIIGSADFYGEQVGLSQSQCMHRGDSKCLFQIEFTAPSR
ncbi:heme NO-binding domain-containing protein [Chitinimonas lacunae]|uniref:Heme NO-binding domain-containing protein n=1 Tax=Chitinimonas lacunae TaxID=1963018 RepID=A0ABV8MRY7_9NEIS